MLKPKTIRLLSLIYEAKFYFCSPKLILDYAYDYQKAFLSRM